MRRGTQQATASLNRFSQQASSSMSNLNNRVSSAMSKISVALAGVFAIGAIARFGKECVELGSNLSEVQNVVDVTFGSMSDNINKFAKTAVTQFGLSETAAKKYASTMGSMLKSMGMSQNQIVGMSKELTGLTGDMASFYNLGADEMFKKIQSGISGEIEPLRQLGINMSVANLEAYALSQGINKAYKNMSQSEQTLLRYNYLLSVTKDAQGDFSRTSDSWANQTRVLNERFNALKATLGQGLINVFTPIVKWLNIIIQKLQGAAESFTNFTNTMFGNASSKQNTGQGISIASENMDTLTENAEEAEEATKKAVKSVMGFDEVNTLNKNDDNSTQLDKLSDISEPHDINMPDTNKQNENLNKVLDTLDNIKQRGKELVDLFGKGFKIGLGNTDFSKLKNNIERIGKALKEIFTDKNVSEAFNNMLDSWALNLGKIAGSMVSVGNTIATNLTGGIAKYLEQNSDFIKDRLVGIFNNNAEFNNILGNFATAFADVFSVFGSEQAQQVSANIIGMFVNPFLTVIEVLEGLAGDIANLIAKPFIENKDGIKEAISNLLTPLETLTRAFKNVADIGCKSLLDAYYKYIKPAFDNVATAISKVTEAFLKMFNEYISPVLTKMTEQISTTIQGKVGPILERLYRIFGKICEVVGVLLKDYIAPLVAFLVEKLSPVVSEVLKVIMDKVDTVISGICGILDGLLTIMEGIIDFIAGVFTADWQRCWEGIKGIFEGIWKQITSTLKIPINLAIAPINGIIDMLNKVKIEIPDWFSNIPGLGDLAGQSWGFNIPNIPKLARGGIVDKTTIAMIGEAGKEAVMPLENNTGWMDDFAIKVANAIGAVNGNNSSNVPINVTLEADMRELARAVIPYLPEASRRMGVSFS